MLNKPTVVVRNVNKKYVLKKDGSERAIFSRKSGTQVEAVRNVSFIGYAGESIGILGRNGSGKSTLLNMIAGSESPTSGLIRVSAQPTLLGVSAALQGHLSGSENIRLGLLAMGVEPEEVAVLLPEILEWAGLETAATRPMSTYSSGMRSRLKFAIATAVNREILLVDEALSTGDATFTAKATERMKNFMSNAGTVFIVSHAAGTIEKFCTRAIWLHDGEIIADGKTSLVAKSYKVWSRYLAANRIEEAAAVIEKRKEYYTPVSIVFDSEILQCLE